MTSTFHLQAKLTLELKVKEWEIRNRDRWSCFFSVKSFISTVHYTLTRRWSTFSTSTNTTISIKTRRMFQVPARVEPKEKQAWTQTVLTQEDTSERWSWNFKTQNAKRKINAGKSPNEKYDGTYVLVCSDKNLTTKQDLLNGCDTILQNQWS